MNAADKQFIGSIPDIYDDYLVPLIFESYAKDLSARVASLDPNYVLETAAGSGVVTRALAPLLSPDAQYHVTDLNPPMIERAKSRQPEDPNIHWQQADALDLPFKDAYFEVVCCQFGAMFFPNRRHGYIEAHRVLSKGGQLIFSVWDDITQNEFAESVTQTTTRFFPDDPPDFLPRTPHGYGDVSIIKDDVRVAGFESVEIHTLTEASNAPSGLEPATGYCQGTPLRNEIEARDKGLLDEITKQAALDIEKKYGSGPVSGKIQGHVIVATK